MMKQTLAAGLLALLASAALTEMAASSAQAAPAAASEALSGCPAGNVCVWVDGPFVGAPTAYGAPRFRNLNQGDHDRVSSWANRTRYQYCLFDNGRRIILDTLGPGRSRAGMRPGTNDRADSIGRC